MTGINDGRKRWLIVNLHYGNGGKALVNTDNIVSIRGYENERGTIYIDTVDAECSLTVDGSLDGIIDYLRNGGIL